MSYLTKLKSLDSEECPPTELPKVPKGAFDSNGGSHGAHFQKTHSEPAITSRGWTVTYPGGQQVEVFVLLADGSCPTRAELLRDFPGATDAEPIPEGI